MWLSNKKYPKAKNQPKKNNDCTGCVRGRHIDGQSDQQTKKKDWLTDS